MQDQIEGASKACPMAPPEQGVTFVELFFDLVFVFSITQMVRLFHHGIHAAEIGQAVLLFWMVWWAWTQYTWALNRADTTHTKVELVVLLATGLTFFMALALPHAFSDAGMLFASAYVLVRLVGLSLYVWVAWSDPVQRQAVKFFFAKSLVGLLAVLVGAWLGGGWQYGLWGFAIGADVLAATQSSKMEGWNINIEHFAERHGLFAIIALGEGLLVVAHGLEAGEWHTSRVVCCVLAVALVCALWWTYFPRAKPALERAIEEREEGQQIALLRDVFTLLHYPMMLGVVALATALESLLTHDVRLAPAQGRWALAVGILLFQGGMGLCLWRVRGKAPWMRFVLTTLVVVGLGAAPGISAGMALGLALLGAVLVALYEQDEDCPGKAQSSSMSL